VRHYEFSKIRLRILSFCSCYLVCSFSSTCGIVLWVWDISTNAQYSLIMKPIELERYYLNQYFNHVLEHGNKCVKCKSQGIVSNFTDNLVEFYCAKCFHKWNFLLVHSIREMLKMGTDAKNLKINKKSN